MKNIKSFENFREKPRPIINSLNQPYIYVNSLNYENVMEIIPKILKNKDSVILQVRVDINDNGMNNYKRILNDLNLKRITGEKHAG